jgi:hypothetical protein
VFEFLRHQETAHASTNIIMMMTFLQMTMIIGSSVLYGVERNLKRMLRRNLFFVGWLLLLLIPQTALFIWMKDPYVHITQISSDSPKPAKNTAGVGETPALVRPSNRSDTKPQAYAVSLTDGIGIAAILTRTANIHQDAPRVESHTTNHPEQIFAVDEKPRKRRIVEIAILILVLSALALFLSPRLG